MSNLYVSHNYPVELSLINTGGGRDDGREIQWRRPLLRPGQKITYSFIAKVVGGNAGSQIHSLTRAMVNEFENVSPVDSYLTIVGGTAAQPGQSYNLVQTGPAGILILMILSALSYFGFGAYQKRRYLKLKKESLRF